MPVFGIEAVTTAIFIIACNPIKDVIPTATKLPNISFARIAISKPLQMKIANNSITAEHPINPSSSASTENIKSLCGSGKYKNFCLLSPRPAPNSPPEPIAYKLCIICHPSPCLSLQGSKNVTILAKRNPPFFWSFNLHIPK